MKKSEQGTIKKLIREYVFLRDGEACFKCHRSNGTLAISHIYSVGSHKNMEFEVDNVKPLCYRCHICWWHKDIGPAWEWINSVLPKTRLDRLKMLSQMSRTAPKYPELKLWLENEIKRIKRDKLTGR